MALRIAFWLTAALWTSALWSDAVQAQDTAPRLAPPPAAAESCAAAPPAANQTWQAPLPEPYHRWREWMTLGRCHLERGEGALAAGYFRQGVREAPELEPAWSLNLLRAAIAAVQPDEAQRLIAQLAPNPVPGLRTALRDMLTQVWRREDPLLQQAVLGMMAAYVAAADPEPEDYDLLAALEANDAAVRSPDGQPLSVLLWRGPKDEPSAQRWRDVPRKPAAAGAVSPSPGDYLRRARQLRRLRLHTLLREELDPERLPELPPDAANTLGQTWFWALGKGRYFTQALQALDSDDVRRRFAFQTRDVLTLSVEYLLRGGQPDAALAKLEALEQEAPQAYVLPGYYLDLARRARTRGDSAGMERWCLRVIERFPGHPRWAESYWLLFWDSYRRGRWEDAVRRGESFLAGGAEVSGRDRVLYWMGRAYAALGRKDDSARVWGTLILESPNSFYGLLVQGETVERLADPSARPKRTQANNGAADPPPVLSGIWDEPRLRIPLLLAILGEDALGEAALDTAIAQPAPEPALRELGAALIHLRKYHLAQKLAVRYLRQGPGAAIDEETMRLVYPLAYWEQIAGGDGERLSPFFVLAVIREESHFRADADSSAGAKGLMQLMPSTAAAVAKDSGIAQEEGSLLRPDVNIALGKLYLEGLRKRFGGNPMHIAAGYNAGPTVVRQWLRTMADLPADEFVEAIPYEETANYVKKVLATSMMYRRIYAGN